MRNNSVENRERKRSNKQEKYRHPKQHGFFDAAQINECQKKNDGYSEHRLPFEPLLWQQAEHGVCAAGHTDGDGQNVIADKRTTGNNARRWRKQFTGDKITATTAREQFDDLRIACANDS